MRAFPAPDGHNPFGRDVVMVDDHRNGMPIRALHTPRALLFATLALALPLALPAQSVVGTVEDYGSGNALGGAELRLLDAADSVVATTRSGEDGRFRLTAPARGEWRVAAELIGYRRTVSAPIALDHDRVVDVQIRMTIEPVAMEEPLVVVGEVTYLNPDIQGFHQRRKESAGNGTFLFGDIIERRAGTRPTDLIRSVAGLRLMRQPSGQGQVIHMRNGCIPAVFIDGAQINRYRPNESIDDYVVSQNIEGIEVYRGTQTAGRFYDRHGCGVVLVWTRRGSAEPTGKEFDLKRVFVFLGLLAGFFVLR